mgnify:CR=1 FL=1
MPKKVIEPRGETGSNTPVYGLKRPSMLEQMLNFYERKYGLQRKDKYRRKPYTTGKPNMAKAPRQANESEEKSPPEGDA